MASQLRSIQDVPMDDDEVDTVSHSTDQPVVPGSYVGSRSGTPLGRPQSRVEKRRSQSKTRSIFQPQPAAPRVTGFMEKFGPLFTAPKRQRPTAQEFMADLDAVINRIDRTAQKTRDQQHIAYASLSTRQQELVKDLESVKDRMEQGENVMEEELDGIQDTISLVTAALGRAWENAELKRSVEQQKVREEQARQATATSNLEQSVGRTQEESHQRDVILETELQTMKQILERDSLEMKGRTRELEQRLAKTEAARQQDQAANTKMLQDLMRQMDVLATTAKPPPPPSFQEIPPEDWETQPKLDDKGKGRADDKDEAGPSDTGRKRQGDNGGKEPPRPPRNAGGPSDPGDDSSSDDSGSSPKWHRDDDSLMRQFRKKRAGTPAERTENEAMRGLGAAIGRGMALATRKHAEPPPIFEAKPYQNVKAWLLQLEDYFKRNPSHWEKQSERIKYALSRTKGEKIQPFADWYRCSMTGELGHKRIPGFKYWEQFYQEITKRYASTAEDREALRKMKEAKYEGKISSLLTEMENLNTKVQMTGIAWRQQIEQKLPYKILERMSTEKKEIDSEWLEALRDVGATYENWLLDQTFIKGEKGEKSSKPQKRKSEDEDKRPDKSQKKRKTYTKAEKAAYKASKRNDKSKVPAKGDNTKPTEWEKMHKGIPQDIVDARKRDGGCTRCGMTNHKWKTCRKEAQVTTVKLLPGHGTRTENHNWKGPKKRQTNVIFGEHVVHSQEPTPKVTRIERPTRVWQNLSDDEMED